MDSMDSTVLYPTSNTPQAAQMESALSACAATAHRAASAAPTAKAFCHRRAIASRICPATFVPESGFRCGPSKARQRADLLRKANTPCTRVVTVMPSLYIQRRHVGGKGPFCSSITRSLWL
jgi:hypothetical protein